MVRRHSLSLTDRTPPGSSLAAEILGVVTPRPDLSKTKSLVNDIKDCISDFGSCVSELSDSGENNADDSEDKNYEGEGFQNVSERKKKKKNKRKRLTPAKEDFMKKTNLAFSPTKN